MEKETKDFFKEDTRTVFEAKEYAQRIAFGPIVFQATRAIKNLGLLTIVEEEGKDGILFEEVVNKSKLSFYGVRVLLEAGLGIGLLTIDHQKYKLTKTGYCILHDDMTIANMDFVNDVCYTGMFDLDKSIEKEKPEGLKALGPWNTVYEGLAFLPAHVQKSWFAFDHFYSDNSFSTVFPHVFKNNPKRILDVGGNTGKWAIKCAAYSESVQVGIVDLPGQLKMAKENIKKEGLTSRVSFYEMNVLEKNAELPKGFDIIWMSQFLDCFSEEQIGSILTSCYDALDNDGHVFILEPFWDKQKFEVSAFCLQMTSLYFTNIANGNSQMYHSDLFTRLIEKAGFTVVEQINNIGISNSLLKCQKVTNIKK